MSLTRNVHVKLFFFFQAEDGIRDLTVTGVQTCALPILIAIRRIAITPRSMLSRIDGSTSSHLKAMRRYCLIRSPTLADLQGHHTILEFEIGRASCRERV